MKSNPSLKLGIIDAEYKKLQNFSEIPKQQFARIYYQPNKLAFSDGQFIDDLGLGFE